MSEIDRINPRPFEAVHEFQGTLTKGRSVLSDRHFVVTYSTRQPSLIRGRILGEESRDEADRLSALMNQPGIYGSLRSKDTEHDGPICESNKVLVRPSRGRRWPIEYGSKMVGVIAELETEELICTRTYRRKQDKTERLISFALAGPKDFWPLYWSRLQSYTGETKFKHNPPSVEIPNPTGANLQFAPHYVFSSISFDDGRELGIEDYYHSIIVKTDLPSTEITDDEFQSQAIEIVNDLLLVASVAARYWIDWFSFQFVASSKFVDHVRSRRESFVESVGHRNTLVDRGQAFDFLTIAVQALREHRDSDFDLYLPLITVMTANTSELLEQRFLFYFMALEQLKDMYAQKKGLVRTVGSNSEGRCLIRDVNSYLDKRLADHPALTLVKEKTVELDRPPLWHVLEKLLLEYDVEWKDLYLPNTEKPTFIGVRNRLVHSAESVEPAQLYFETERLRVVIERLLLKSLRWQDTYGAASSMEAKGLAAGPQGGKIVVTD